MKSLSALALAALLAWIGGAVGQSARNGPIGPVKSDLFHTDFVRTSNNSFGLLYQPETPGPNARVAIVYASPRALFNFAPAAEMANRGYRVLLVKHYLADRRRVRQTSTDGLREASRGISYVRALPGVERVVLMGHDAGGGMAALYMAAAEQGTAICQRQELLYHCTKSHTSDLTGLAKADGVILLDPTLGAFETTGAMDPAFKGNTRSLHDLDMYAAGNGYDPRTGQAHYSAAFVKRFFAAQSARNTQIIDRAAARLQLVEQGKSDFIDDAPFVVAGAYNSGDSASLFDADLALLASTKAPHGLLKVDGSTAQTIVQSVRPSAPAQTVSMMAECCRVVGTTVRRFLDNDAVRTTGDFSLTVNDIVGVDWKTSLTSTPANAENISAPALVLTMSCARAVVPGEIVFDHLAAKDKAYVAVEGAGADFAACKREYGDTKKRAFDFVDHWLAERGRF
jgi:pimeloyl-ACP methyl ester carboxylesterase